MSRVGQFSGGGGGGSVATNDYFESSTPRRNLRSSSRSKTIMSSTFSSSTSTATTISGSNESTTASSYQAEWSASAATGQGRTLQYNETDSDESVDFHEYNKSLRILGDELEELNAYEQLATTTHHQNLNKKTRIVNKLKTVLYFSWKTMLNVCCLPIYWILVQNFVFEKWILNRRQEIEGKQPRVRLQLMDRTYYNNSSFSEAGGGAAAAAASSNESAHQFNHHQRLQQQHDSSTTSESSVLNRLYTFLKNYKSRRNSSSSSSRNTVSNNNHSSSVFNNYNYDDDDNDDEKSSATSATILLGKSKDSSRTVDNGRSEKSEMAFIKPPIVVPAHACVRRNFTNFTSSFYNKMHSWYNSARQQIRANSEDGSLQWLWILLALLAGLSSLWWWSNSGYGRDINSDWLASFVPKSPFFREPDDSSLRFIDPPPIPPKHEPSPPVVVPPLPKSLPPPPGIPIKEPSDSVLIPKPPVPIVEERQPTPVVPVILIPDEPPSCPVCPSAPLIVTPPCPTCPCPICPPIRNEIDILSLKKELTDHFTTLLNEKCVSNCNCPVGAGGGGSSTASTTVNTAGGVDTEHIEKMIKIAIAKYDADKTGLPDLALEPSGGSVVSTRCTKHSQNKNSVVSFFGIPIWSPPNNPRTVIQPGLVPGECWSFEGSIGYIVIKLAGPSYIAGFSLEHIPKEVSPLGHIKSAPKNFQVVGLTDYTDASDEFIFGDYVYQDNGESLQYFKVQNEPLKAYPYIELKISSNHGNIEFTCLYRFRVHGHF